MPVLGSDLSSLGPRSVQHPARRVPACSPFAGAGSQAPQTAQCASWRPDLALRATLLEEHLHALAAHAKSPRTQKNPEDSLRRSFLKTPMESQTLRGHWAPHSRKICCPTGGRLRERGGPWPTRRFRADREPERGPRPGWPHAASPPGRRPGPTGVSLRQARHSPAMLAELRLFLSRALCLCGPGPSRQTGAKPGALHHLAARHHRLRQEGLGSRGLGTVVRVVGVVTGDSKVMSCTCLCYLSS